ncbi:MAG: lytic transglycosylase domain-containing protein [Myxococcota bacterium]
MKPLQNRSAARRGPVRRLLGLGLGLLLGLAWSGAIATSAHAGGNVYRYIDDAGTVHFSNVPVDERFKRMKTKAAQSGHSITPNGRRSRIPEETYYDRMIMRHSERNKVEPALVKAVIAAESNFEPFAVSRVGAQGLMQLMPQTAEELGVRTPFLADDNIDGGSRYLRMMLDRYGDVTRALAAYNAGPKAVDRYKGVPPYKETQAYVKRVLKYYRHYRSDFRPPHRVLSSKETLAQNGAPGVNFVGRTSSGQAERLAAGGR